MEETSNIHTLEDELFSWKTTSQKDHLEVCPPIFVLIAGLYGMLSSMKITLDNFQMLIGKRE